MGKQKDMRREEGHKCRPVIYPIYRFRYSKKGLNWQWSSQILSELFWRASTVAWTRDCSHLPVKEWRSFLGASCLCCVSSMRQPSCARNTPSTVEAGEGNCSFLKLIWLLESKQSAPNSQNTRREMRKLPCLRCSTQSQKYVAILYFKGRGFTQFVNP